MAASPLMDVGGIANFRDIGGYEVQVGNARGVVRRGIVFRSADPSRCSAAGKATLQELGIKTIFDLRSQPEVDKAALGAPIEIPGVKREFVPVFATADYSPEAIAVRYKDYCQGGPEGFTKAYRDILLNGGPAFRKILTHVRDSPNEPCLLHCSAGKDRTGVAVALLLKIAGVSDELIGEEYAHTEQGLLELRPLMMKHLLSNETVGGNEDRAVRMMSAKSENMLAALAMLQEDFGGVTGYIERFCELKRDDLEHIKRNLISTKNSEMSRSTT